MKLKVQNFVEKNLSNARYEYDRGVKSWAGWIEGLPGVYAQGKTIEAARDELGEILEEYLLINLQEKKKVKGFALPNYALAR
mgnify:CR=1 FL=1